MKISRSTLRGVGMSLLALAALAFFATIEWKWIPLWAGWGCAVLGALVYYVGPLILGRPDPDNEDPLSKAKPHREREWVYWLGIGTLLLIGSYELHEYLWVGPPLDPVEGLPDVTIARRGLGFLAAVCGTLFGISAAFMWVKSRKCLRHPKVLMGGISSGLGLNGVMLALYLNRLIAWLSHGASK